MPKLPLFACLILLASPALAIGGLPVVNPANSVSALDLYGVAPAAKQETRNKRQETSDFVVSIPESWNSKPRSRPAEYLVPNKPSGDLWSNNLYGDPPLRMPEKSEYSFFSASDFALPDEEELDEELFPDPEPQYFAAARSVAAPRRVRPSQGSGRAKVEFSAPAAPLPVPASGAAPSVREGPKPSPIRKSPTMIRSAPKYKPARKSSVPDPETRVVQPEQDVDDEFAYKNMDEIPLTRLSPSQLKRAFKKTFTTENKHLSTYQIDDGFDEASESSAMVGFDSSRDLSEQSGGVRPLEIKIGFNDDDSSLSRDNYNLLTEYAGIVAANPKRAVQVSISERATRSYDGRKLAARRLAIIEQVLRDSGIIDRRIIPVLSQRSDDSFVLRVISNDMFQTLTEKKRDIFGDTTNSKTYRSMSW
jgi:outer membrane protein OmpA-like peptidoglycan-associated protein